MKYIRIKNKGLIEPQALHLLGASTKTNDATKIGQFGSESYMKKINSFVI